MIKKTPNPVDIHVGSRVRLRRMMLKISQDKLGEQLGVTFQQVQKYEKGRNRIGASRLQHIARILEVPIEFFFEDCPDPNGEKGPENFAEAERSQYIVDFVSSSEGLRLNRAFARIQDEKVRRKVVELVSTLADFETSD